MAIVVFFLCVLFMKDAKTPHQIGKVDEFGRGVDTYKIPVYFGSECAHINCGATLDPMLMRVANCGDDVVITDQPQSVDVCRTQDQ